MCVYVKTENRKRGLRASAREALCARKIANFYGVMRQGWGESGWWSGVDRWIGCCITGRGEKAREMPKVIKLASHKDVPTTALSF